MIFVLEGAEDKQTNICSLLFVCGFSIRLFRGSLLFCSFHYIIFQEKNLLTAYVIEQSVRQLHIIFVQHNNCDFIMVLFELFNL